MIPATLCFLIKKHDNKITKVCLAQKKRGFGEGYWNGVGGKVKPGETLRQTSIREAREEIGVTIQDPTQVADIKFYFPQKPEIDMRVYAFFVENWRGDPKESDEMRPEWFTPEDAPYDSMWSSDRYWIPKVFRGQLIEGEVSMDLEQNLLEKNLRETKSFQPFQSQLTQSKQKTESK